METIPKIVPLHKQLPDSQKENSGEKAKPYTTFVRCPIVSSCRAVNNEATPSVAFAYLGAYIAKAGYEYTIIDGIAEALNQVWPLTEFPGYQCQGLTLEEIIERIPLHTDVIGFSAMFSGEWPVLRQLIKMTRTRFPKALLVAGGEHITALTEYSLRDCRSLDLCICGEGEHTLLEILDAFHHGKDLSPITGTAFLDEVGTYVQVGGLSRIRDINAIPWPIWLEGYLEKFWQAGKSYGVQSERDMPILASRGCPINALFVLIHKCGQPVIFYVTLMTSSRKLSLMFSVIISRPCNFMI